MYNYRYEVTYQSRNFLDRTKKCYVDIACKQKNYATALFSNAVRKFCQERNNDRFVWEWEVVNIKFVRCDEI